MDVYCNFIVIDSISLNKDQTSNFRFAVKKQQPFYAHRTNKRPHKLCVFESFAKKMFGTAREDVKQNNCARNRFYNR